MTTTVHLDKLTDLLSATVAEELDCDAVLDRLAAYLEHSADAELPPDLAAVEQHLRVCPDCHEEYQALVAAFS